MGKKDEISNVDEESGNRGVSVFIDAEAEKARVQKLDLVLFPCLTLVSNYLSQPTLKLS